VWWWSASTPESAQDRERVPQEFLAGAVAMSASLPFALVGILASFHPKAEVDAGTRVVEMPDV
jgi:hypothetical protein